MGGSSPTVFHTTPPQPASKARTTLYSLSVGGAEASQKGLGLLIPTNVLVRSAMGLLRHSRGGGNPSRASDGAVGGDRRALPMLHRFHGEVAAAVGAVAAGPDLRERRAAFGVDDDAAAIELDGGSDGCRDERLADG